MIKNFNQVSRRWSRIEKVYACVSSTQDEPNSSTRADVGDLKEDEAVSSCLNEVVDSSLNEAISSNKNNMIFSRRDTTQYSSDIFDLDDYTKLDSSNVGG